MAAEFDPHDITVAVLAGGAGTRMDGRDKGLVELGGRPLVAHVVAALAGQTGAVLICANRNADAYAAYGRVIADADAQGGLRGPLAGIAAALAHCTTPWLLTVPVDAPAPPAHLARALLGAAGAANADAAVAWEGVGPQPMFALYRSRLVESAATALAQDLPVWQWQQQIRAEPVFFDDGEFVNLNTAAELSQWESAHGRH